MYRGVAIWNYAGDAVENAERFHKAGFDAISWNAPLFVDRYNDDDRERVAEYLKRSGQYFTMHNLLPSPYDPQEQASAKEISHLTCGAYFFSRRMLMAMARLSELRGSTLSKAMRFSSMNSFQPVPSTRPIICCLFMLGP